MDEADKLKALINTQKPEGAAVPPATEKPTETIEKPPVDTKPEEKPAGELPVDDKRSAQGRIREVVKEKNQLKELVDQIDTITNQPVFNGPSMQPDEQGQVTAEQIINESQRRATSAAYLVNQQQRAVDNLRKETSEIEKDYPELNPDHERYDKDLSESIATAVESQVKVLAGYDPKGQPIYAINPNAKPKDIVSKMMKPYRKSLNQAQAQTEAATNKAVAEQALRPTPTTPIVEKEASDMSTKELEKKLGVIY
jgi:hypothetical protein